MDVYSLYTNLSNNEGIKAVEVNLKQKKNSATRIIITFLHLILTISFSTTKTTYKMKGVAWKQNMLQVM